MTLNNLVGPVVTTDDWLRISLTNYSLYRILAQEDKNGKCFSTTYAIALYVSDCTFIFGSMQLENGKDTAHVVLFKKGWVYDSNLKIHCKYEEYKELFGFKKFVRTKLLEQDYNKFLDIVLEKLGYRNWCKANNVILLI